jgi:hypothetical protein
MCRKTSRRENGSLMKVNFSAGTAEACAPEHDNNLNEGAATEANAFCGRYIGAP